MTFLTVPDAEYRINVVGSPHRSEKFTYIASSSSTRVHSYDNSTLEPESKSGRAMLDLDLAVGVSMVIGVKPQKRRRLERSIQHAVRCCFQLKT